MKFKYTILYVKDVEETLGFFERAFGFTRKMLHESGDYGELDTGETTLSFASLKLMRDTGKNPAIARSDHPSFEVAFETDDVKKSLKKALGAGAKLIQDVEYMPWGQFTSYVTDEIG
jgi:uncharacterized glyoxalase superfamily protein PhnB